MSIFVFYACGNSEKEGLDGTNNDILDMAQSTNISEDFFVWEENYIVELTEEGKQQKTLIIPSRCEGFLGKILSDENSVEYVCFESDKNIELNRGLSLAVNLKKVELPAELSEIGTLEFWSCEKLEQITIPQNITVIGDSAFQECKSLRAITFEGNITEIQEEAFKYCISLSEIMLPQEITNIAEETFYGCESLINLSLPSGLLDIGKYAFYGCSSLKDLSLPSGLKNIGSHAFFGCNSFENLILPGSVISIGTYAYAETGIKDVRIPRELVLSEYKDSSFVINEKEINIHITEGSWMDKHFEEMFLGSFNKIYETEN